MRFWPSIKQVLSPLFCVPILLFWFKSHPLLAKSPKYKVEFQGVDSITQRRSLKNASSLFRYRRHAPASLAALRYRAEQDIPEFIEVLKAYSYYDACVTTRAFRLPKGHYRMIVSVDKGSPYLLSEFEFNTQKDYKEELYRLQKVHLRELGLKLGRPAVASKIVDAEKQLISILSRHGHPFAEISQQSIIVDQAQKTMSVNLEIDEGPIAYFGDVTIVGGEGVSRRFVRNRIAWKEGDLFNSRKVSETEKSLYDSGLFSIVSITHDKNITADNTLPLKIDLLDAKYRSVTLGGSYTTTWEGFGGGATWQNRNLFHTALDLKINYSINQKKNLAGLQFIIPDFLGGKNRLVAQSDVMIRNVMPTYQEKGVTTKLYIERIFNRHFKASVGGEFDQFKNTQSLRNGYFSIFGIPLFFNTQSSDKVLINPTQGGWFSINYTPYFGLNSITDDFSNIKLQGSVYQYLIPSRRIILAMNAVLGSLFGCSLYNVPPSYRYYGGSPNHLRGYPYQKVSPLNAQGQETGGRSLFLWSIEPRIMILKSFAVVGFLDVGNVYRSSWPHFRDKLVKSLGVGARYYSLVGPIRLDVGFPLDKLPNDKRHYQIYVSIGQAF